jgi:hypothetical protein
MVDSSNAAAMWAVDELIAGGVDPITKGLYCTDCGIGGSLTGDGRRSEALNCVGTLGDWLQRDRL